MRWVIRAPGGAYFTEFKVVETRSVTLNGVFIGTESEARPLFEGFTTKHAAKFDSEDDARRQVENSKTHYPLLGGPEAFAGCTIHSTED